MRVTRLPLEGILLIEPKVFPDPRGHFLETFQARRYSEYGIPSEFVQDNLSYSVKDVVRGLHYQLRQPQGKLVMVLAGRVLDVVLDVRRGSPDFGRWITIPLSADPPQQLYVPPGFAHGFWVTSSTAQVLYKCTDFYAPGDEYGIIWNDPDLGIGWPAGEPLLSDKDARFPVLREVPPEYLPVFTPPARKG